MKKINPPENDDVAELIELSYNTRLGSYPALNDNLNAVDEQYAQYIKNKGNPWLITSCHLPAELQKALIGHYTNSPKEALKFLSSYRYDLSPDLCPMCGGLGFGTLDHYLPKDTYAEFALLSKNLVPACNCNLLRNTTVRGDKEPARVIHPYFDDFLDDRLYQSVFHGDFETPSISVEVVDSDHVQRDILDFHLAEVVLNNNILSFLEKRWVALSEKPHKLLKSYLPADSVNVDIVKKGIMGMVEAKDDEYETPNNWWSIFYSGLLNDEGRLDRLAVIINSMRG